MRPKILWIEGKRAESPHFIPGLRKKGYQVEVVATGNEALDNLTILNPNMVVINAASMRTTGKRIARSLRAKVNSTPILTIVNCDQAVTADPSIDEILALPFTSRKLLNRIQLLLPGDSLNTIQIGPIHLDLERKRVRCQERISTLTPRLTELLKIFLEHPGVVLEREDLFRKIWNTEYTADTRTLDVHISWLRQAIEAEPRKPQFLHTARGVGYRLDV